MEYSGVNIVTLVYRLGLQEYNRYIIKVIMFVSTIIIVLANQQLIAFHEPEWAKFILLP